MAEIVDTAPELISKVKKYIRIFAAENDTLTSIQKKIEDGSATYSDTAEYARLYGEIVKQAMNANVSSASLPDGKMYYNIADRLFDDVLTEDYNEISQVCYDTQTALNAAANMNMKAQRVTLNEDRIQGFKELASRANQYDDVRATIHNGMQNFTQSIVDDSVKTNAKFQADAGYHPRIVRKAAWRCCEWCAKLAGSYNYPEDCPDNVFHRHSNCNCVVTYNPGDGKRQDVWSKKREPEETSSFELSGNEDYMKKASYDYSYKDASGKVINKTVSVSQVDDKIYTESYDDEAKKMVSYVQSILQKNPKYQEVDGFYILKDMDYGLSFYDHGRNVMAINQALIDSSKFEKLVSKDFFAASDLSDVFIHEIEGHKAHWDAVKRYFANGSFSTIGEAKMDLEASLRKYVKEQSYMSFSYIQNVVSKNAEDGIRYEKSLNELIADGKVLINKGSLNDRKLEKLIEEVLNL